MSWNNKELMPLKQEFIQLFKDKVSNFSDLCKKFNISRKTGYKWIKRYKEEGVLGLNDRSRRPCYMPFKISSNYIEIVTQTRDENPSWGAKKLRQVLCNKGHENLPSISSFNRILRRQGRISPEEAAKRHAFKRFEREYPNELWQMDFKGHFSLKVGRCYPLTILDDCSRFSICLKACSSEDETSVRTALEVAFCEFGLPEAMTMDNGSPWKGAPSQRLTKLTVWLMRLGIRVGHSTPYHPQTQGKDERFHRTLKEEVLKYHNFPSLEKAQEHFDEWRYKYNHIRPHEALGMLCPAQKYEKSQRNFSKNLPSIEYLPEDQVRMVTKGGEIAFEGTRYYIGEHLRGELVAVRPSFYRKERWDIYFANSRVSSFEKKV